MKIIKTIIYNLRGDNFRHPKMERKLYFQRFIVLVLKKLILILQKIILNKIIIIVGIEFLQLKFKGKHPYTRFKTFSITPARVNSAKRASFAGAEILSPCLIYALIRNNRLFSSQVKGNSLIYIEVHSTIQVRYTGKYILQILIYHGPAENFYNQKDITTFLYQISFHF